MHPWTPNDVFVVRSSGGRQAALTPVDAISWGPGKADWLYVYHQLAFDGRAAPGLYERQALWSADGRLCAVVHCANPAISSGACHYAPLGWRPAREVWVMDLNRACRGRAAFDRAAQDYTLTALDAERVVYVKRKGADWEMEVAIADIRDWRPLFD